MRRPHRPGRGARRRHRNAWLWDQADAIEARAAQARAEHRDIEEARRNAVAAARRREPSAHVFTGRGTIYTVASNRLVCWIAIVPKVVTKGGACKSEGPRFTSAARSETS